MSLTRRLCDKYNISINYEGKVLKILPEPHCKLFISEVICFYLLALVFYILKELPYHEVTIVGYTSYSRVVASCLNNHNIPFVLCKGNSRATYYKVENREDICFEDPNVSLTDDPIPMIPLTNEELLMLQEHTNLNNLDKIQDIIINKFDYKEGLYFTKMDNLIYQGEISKGPIVSIKKFIGNLYYVISNKEIWISRFIITDKVYPLRGGEIISSLYYSNLETSAEQYKLEHLKSNKSKVVVTDNYQKTVISRENSYFVDEDLSVYSLKIPYEIRSESIFYNLKNPRRFYKDIYNIHPFHLPSCWDIFLSIMIVTLSLVK